MPVLPPAPGGGATASVFPAENGWPPSPGLAARPRFGATARTASLARLFAEFLRGLGADRLNVQPRRTQQTPQRQAQR